MKNCLGEKELIDIFLTELPVSPYMQNKFFESDAEVLTCGTGKLLFTTDEFSDEDLFRTDNPFRLGYNLAAATISDILAVGGIPYAYAHAVRASSSWDREYVTKLAQGIAAVLKICEIGSIGGDMGMASHWSYTGTCLGFSPNPISRKGATERDHIYMTGAIGAGNIEAAFSLFDREQFVQLESQFVDNYFPVRIKESQLIGQWASCCIDSSDGVLNALNTLAELNGLGYKVENLPYLPETKLLCRLLKVPKEALFMGECGEYELVFAVPPENNKAFLKVAHAKDLKFALIGEFTKAETRILTDDGKVWNLERYNVSARDYNSRQDYLNKLLDFLRNESYN
ncbi:MAG: thiamine-phosphate kinase [Bacteroidota bacterium]|nr:thiamine monophosphate kinase [Odoribacter sp.]MDP3643335.1 thiamine-phosphate kinase [Bacteroidota bacterium]